MIWFVDLENGNVYDGLNPYIHYFEKQQSTGLIYTKNICVVSDKEKLNIKVEKNNIFHLIDISKLDKTIEVNDFQYHDVNKLYVDNYTSTGYPYESYYLHMIYITASSDNIGEFQQELSIGNDKITLGADFYMEYEPHKINLANMGVEIPDSIQKAIYEVNVHEENKDNITLNRKWKELLLNYWNIIANKGSYNSLINSLNWFEYGDLVTIKEFWKHKEWGLDRFNHNDLSPILSQNLNSMLSNFSKTTYIGLYLALQGFTKKDDQLVYEPFERNETTETLFGNIELKSAKLDRQLANNNPDGSTNQLLKLTNNTYIDKIEDPNANKDLTGSNWKQRSYEEYNGFLSEKNPYLYNLSLLWNTNDLNLKMYLLGSFYEAYFMPIHLDLLHSTVETIVYTNTIKIINNTRIDRYDYIGLPRDFECSVSNGDIFRLGNVEVQVGPKTTFGHQWEKDHNYEDMYIFGVDSIVDRLYKEDDLRTFYSQDYSGVGVVVPFECKIPVERGVFINRSQLTVTRKGVCKTQTFNTLFAEKNGIITIKFNLLFTDDENNRIILEFRTNSGETFIKSITIKVINTNVEDIKVYRIKSKDFEKLESMGYDPQFNHIMTHIRELSSVPDLLIQYIPASLDANNDGAKLNNVVVIDMSKLYMPANVLPKFIEICFPSTFWRVYTKETQNTSKPYSYLIAVSKRYIYNTNQLYNPDQYLKIAIETYCNNIDYKTVGRYCMIRNDVGFFPENHYLVPIEGDKLKDFTVGRNEALCVIPELDYSRLDVSEYEWVFTNMSTGKDIQLRSVENPIIAEKDSRFLDPGYYKITFRYKLGSNEGIQEISRNSAFLIK